MKNKVKELTEKNNNISNNFYETVDYISALRDFNYFCLAKLEYGEWNYVFNNPEKYQKTISALKILAETFSLERLIDAANDFKKEYTPYYQIHANNEVEIMTKKEKEIYQDIYNKIREKSKLSDDDIWQLSRDIINAWKIIEESI